MNQLIPINKPLLDDEEIKAVVKVLKSNILTSRGESKSNVKLFEKNFARFAQAKHAFALNSGTAALYMSLLASGITVGSEVIVPSFTFVSTAETVVLAGGKPVFVDINPETYNIDPADTEEAVTAKTKAIIPVDLFGLPANVETIKEIALRHNLTVVEDAAQAHGAQHQGKPVGTYANLTCWSFYASKNMTTGEGGMITTNEDEYAMKIPYMRSHGEKKQYVSTMIGGNFRMPEIEAAIGIVQLRKLSGFLKARRRNARRLTAKLQNIKELTLPKETKNNRHSWYLYTVRLKTATRKERDSTVNRLRKLGVGTTVYYPTPIHQMPFYRKYCKHKLPNTEKAATQIFSLPVHPSVTTKDVDYIADSLRKVLRSHVAR